MSITESLYVEYQLSNWYIIQLCYEDLRGLTQTFPTVLSDSKLRSIVSTIKATTILISNLSMSRYLQKVFRSKSKRSLDV